MNLFFLILEAQEGNQYSHKAKQNAPNIQIKKIYKINKLKIKLEKNNKNNDDDDNNDAKYTFSNITQKLCTKNNFHVQNFNAF